MLLNQHIHARVATPANLSTPRSESAVRARIMWYCACCNGSSTVEWNMYHTQRCCCALANLLLQRRACECASESESICRASHPNLNLNLNINLNLNLPHRKQTLPAPPCPRAQVAVAVALILAAVCATGCLGVACGKCWLNKQRSKTVAEREEAEEERLKLQPTYDHKPGGAGLPGKLKVCLFFLVLYFVYEVCKFYYYFFSDE